MNRFIYTLLLYLSLPIAVLKIITKERKSPFWKVKLKNQLGFITKTSSNVIWVHCVSVGEFNAARPLIDQLLDIYPEHRLVITTTTITGAVAVRNHYQDRVIHYFFPFDLPFIVGPFIKKINPVACILLETEIWPNLINNLNKKTIPVMLINARLSERSLKKYQKFSTNLVRKTINQLTLICSQNDTSSERFLSLGASPDKVITVGNLKFDSNEKDNPNTTKSLQQIIGQRRVVVFASTREGEEKKIIQSYVNLKDKFDALLIIVPRHPQRFDEVFDLIIDSGLDVKRRSQGLGCDENTQVLLGDSMGELLSYYSVCDIAFIGGSLIDTGGQNMLEAAAASKPILFGPSVFNFEKIAQQLLENKAAIQVEDVDNLMKTIPGLLLDDTRRQKLGRNAKATFEKHRGAVNRLMKLLIPKIS
ncbi:lipid IV(A) 3-deoxy-D-manno-octulosonic acid transferase [Candidatus Thioglobus sp.]|nr:lipid IV(A) 3-deoxy-D-manno-octulosonic acid transferase [Candidatus Thioglobus sp.]